MSFVFIVDINFSSSGTLTTVLLLHQCFNVFCFTIKFLFLPVICYFIFMLTFFCPVVLLLLLLPISIVLQSAVALLGILLSPDWYPFFVFVNYHTHYSSVKSDLFPLLKIHCYDGLTDRCMVPVSYTHLKIQISDLLIFKSKISV